MTGIGENTLAQAVKPPLRERRACLAKLVKNRLTLTRRKPLAAVLALLSAALVLGGNALLDAGWGSALRSIADRVLPNPEIAMWAPAPEPGSHASSYADATGAGANYVYLVDAADDRGNVRELQLIFFGRESNGEGWLEIEARGGSGVRYRACDAAEPPAAARRALDR